MEKQHRKSRDRWAVMRSPSKTTPALRSIATRLIPIVAPTRIPDPFSAAAPVQLASFAPSGECKLCYL